MKSLIFLILVGTVFQSHADDLAAGRAKAEAACSLCHGVNGVASLPNAPNLAGQQMIYMSEQLKNYRSGKRQSEVMNLIAKQLTDAEINNVSLWYSSVKITAEMP